VADVSGVEVAEELMRCFLARVGPGDEGLLREQVLVAALFPFGEVGVESGAAVAQAFDDMRIGEAVHDPAANLVADWPGEARNLAVAAVSSVEG